MTALNHRGCIRRCVPMCADEGLRGSGRGGSSFAGADAPVVDGRLGLDVGRPCLHRSSLACCCLGVTERPPLIVRLRLSLTPNQQREIDTWPAAHIVLLLITIRHSIFLSINQGGADLVKSFTVPVLLDADIGQLHNIRPQRIAFQVPKDLTSAGRERNLKGSGAVDAEKSPQLCEKPIVRCFMRLEAQ